MLLFLFFVKYIFYNLLFIANELNSSARNYSNLTDQFNKTQGQLDEMPQSAAIQEKLRRFETINDAKPFSSHQSNNQNYKPTMMNTTEKSKESTTSLGRGLIDETSRVTLKKIFIESTGLFLILILTEMYVY